ncbi:hypothetical protein A2U01_0087123, partial [Trifolium medium]|nr:hypothetical protein [Trifolium medium]
MEVSDENLISHDSEKVENTPTEEIRETSESVEGSSQATASIKSLNNTEFLNQSWANMVEAEDNFEEAPDDDIPP